MRRIIGFVLLSMCSLLISSCGTTTDYKSGQKLPISSIEEAYGGRVVLVRPITSDNFIVDVDDIVLVVLDESLDGTYVSAKSMTKSYAQNRGFGVDIYVSSKENYNKWLDYINDKRKLKAALKSPREVYPPGR